MPVIYKDQAKAEPFSKYAGLARAGHSNTITIKPYPDKVSGDPTAGKLDLPVAGSQSPGESALYRVTVNILDY